MNKQKKPLFEEPTIDEYVLKGTNLYTTFRNKDLVASVLKTCSRLRHKTSVLNRRLLKVKAENRRLRKLLDGLKSIEIED